MPSTRSPRRKSLGEDSKPTTPKKILKLPNKGFRRKPWEIAEFAHGTVPLRTSLRLKNKERWLGRVRTSRYSSSREVCKPTTSKKSLKLPNKGTYLTAKQIAESALCDYNKKHGTDLKYVRLSHGRERDFFGPGYNIDFVERYRIWKHFNFEARRRNADPGDEPLLLFGEVYKAEKKYHLSTLSLVEPTDESYGFQRCWSYISHPRHGFRAGFDTKVACEPKILSKQDAAQLAELALEDYNEKHGTNLKFERALECNKFTCEGLLLDLNKKNTSWVHMNFEARVGPKEGVLLLFAELYVGDDGNFVLATLSVAEPCGKWKEEINLARECVCCPDEIRHPWRGFRYAFNYPPNQIAPDKYAEEEGIEYSNTIRS